MYRYQYKGFWVEVSINLDAQNQITYIACIESPRKGEVIQNYPAPSREEADFAAEELIDSWN